MRKKKKGTIKGGKTFASPHHSPSYLLPDLSIFVASRKTAAFIV